MGIAAQPPRILLVANGPAARAATQACGAAPVEPVGSLTAALERIPRGAFDIVVAALDLPDSRGLDTLGRLAQATDHPIVALGDGGHAEAALDLGAYEFLRLDEVASGLGRAVRLAARQAGTARLLRESEARFRGVIDLSSDFYWETDERHRIARSRHGPKHRPVNAPGSGTGKTRWEIPSTRPDAQGWAAHRATLEAHLPFRDFELSRIDPNGVERHLSLSGEPMFDEGGQFIGYRGVGRDITARKQVEDRILHLATRDALTGLPNRSLLSERLSLMIAQAKRQATLLAVLFIDLDGFKQVNDCYGHAAGDELLRETARRLEGSVRECDTVGRVSGDEFVIVLGSLERPDLAPQVADKILEALAKPVALGEKRASVTASIGISLHPADGSDSESLLSAADAAMYRAKQAGRNAYRVFGGA